MSQSCVIRSVAMSARCSFEFSKSPVRRIQVRGLGADSRDKAGVVLSKFTVMQVRELEDAEGGGKVIVLYLIGGDRK